MIRKMSKKAKLKPPRAAIIIPQMPLRSTVFVIVFTGVKGSLMEPLGVAEAVLPGPAGTMLEPPVPDCEPPVPPEVPPFPGAPAPPAGAPGCPGFFPGATDAPGAAGETCGAPETLGCGAGEAGASPTYGYENPPPPPPPLEGDELGLGLACGDGVPLPPVTELWPTAFTALTRKS